MSATQGFEALGGAEAAEPRGVGTLATTIGPSGGPSGSPPGGPPTGQPASDLGAVYDIPVQVSAVLGRTTMQVSQLLKLGRGAVVELDRKLGEAVDIYVNNRLVARGEVVMVDDNRLGVTMTEIVKADRSA
ncbi:flagellar motor switch protein FliN [Roseomonas sp. NAR14]|uniref:Flagellar motor switch protein FliN n=1 Tax=Roseomonas acroporae TaxID=2937791 RepID=A0A9X1Y4R8_9PROT|nr:flagellar motor switch protein FliN [Roseomonas acroporae]MCK8783040.1 flagellar motor switch protein FliN [Roseomonas acroporae]